MRGEHVVSVNENRGNVRDLALRLVESPEDMPEEPRGAWEEALALVII